MLGVYMCIVCCMCVVCVCHICAISVLYRCVMLERACSARCVYVYCVLYVCYICVLYMCYICVYICVLCWNARAVLGVSVCLIYELYVLCLYVDRHMMTMYVYIRMYLYTYIICI